MTENDIQNAIMEYLSWNKILVWRHNNTPVYDIKSGRYRKMGKWAMKGVSDILGVYKGRFLAIEVKAPKKYPSKEQREFMQKINDEGGIAFIARSIDQVKEELARADAAGPQ